MAPVTVITFDLLGVSADVFATVEVGVAEDDQAVTWRVVEEHAWAEVNAYEREASSMIRGDAAGQVSGTAGKHVELRLFERIADLGFRMGDDPQGTLVWVYTNDVGDVASGTVRRRDGVCVWRARGSGRVFGEPALQGRGRAEGLGLGERGPVGPEEHDAGDGRDAELGGDGVVGPAAL